MPTNNLALPWLDNGMLVQLPARLEIRNIAPTVRFPDGSVIVSASEAKAQFRWSLRYENLNTAEWERMREFLDASDGGGAAFAFYDPFGNLLRHSGDLAQPVWLRPSGLDVEPIEDPDFAKAFILTNGTSGALTLSQSVGVKGAFRTCFSVMAKWENPISFSIEQSADGETASATAQAAAWTRSSVVQSAGAENESRTVSIVVPPTTQIIIAEPHLEIAAAPGAYVESGNQGGVFPAAWLNQKRLDLESQAPGANSISLFIESIRPL